MDKFVSIAVNQGDAFYLERDGVKILVDGGRSRVGFGEQFLRTIGPHELDVVVCSHADADHINGLLGYFSSGLKAKEVWLPGVWSSRLADTLSDSRMFVTELVHETYALEGELPKNLVDLSADFERGEYRKDRSGVRDSEGFGRLYKAIEEYSGRPDNLQSLGFDFVKYWCWDDAGSSQARLIIDALSVVEKIRELATLAYHSGAKIRWFEFISTGSASGGEGFLKPVNSREITSMKQHVGALEYAYLSIANKQSLVFHSPASNHAGHVMFSADSDYFFGATFLPVQGNGIVTAPHHGSEDNANAYQYLNDSGFFGADVFFVRSDGRFVSRPGQSYKQVNARKFCTLCRHPKPKRQDIVFESVEGKWMARSDVLECYCDDADVDYVEKKFLT